ncbi:MAG: diacylglycerol kinase family lipid kinase [Actinophytocola sp.]|nr:diacylglycerol kinase family lipid kinase [Actinophytocola sp.]
MRSFTALVNPIAGGGHALRVWEPIAAALSSAGARTRVVKTTDAAHAASAAAEAARAGDVVVAVGGDGLVRDAAGGVVDAGGVLGVVPAGRGNDLGRTLGLPAGDAELARLLLSGDVRAIDVLDADGVVVPGNVYVGVDSMSTRIINDTRWLPALLAYRLAPVRAILRWRSPTFTVTTDGDARTVRAHSVVVANSGAYGHGLRIVPPAVLDDGALDVLTVGAGPRRDLVKFMREAKTGEHVRRAEVTLTTGRSVTIDADADLPVGADGDEIGTLPVTVRLRPGALRLLAPPPAA